MEVKVNALVIKSIDYKDNDKLLTLYSLESGKITANIKGVKRAGAKLKFASEPFCFSEYILAQKSGRNTVINASYIDSFYKLRLDIKKYYTSSVIAEILNAFLEPEVPNVDVFKISINAVKEICYNDSEVLSLLKFLYKITNSLGYGYGQSTCFYCNQRVKGRVFYRFKDSRFSCQNCLEEGFNEIKEKTYLAFNKLQTAVESQKELVLSGEEEVLLVKFMLYYLNYKTDTKIKSGESLILFLNKNSV